MPRIDRLILAAVVFVLVLFFGGCQTIDQSACTAECSASMDRGGNSPSTAVEVPLLGL